MENQEEFEDNAEVSGKIVIAVLEGLPQYADVLKEVFAHNQLTDIDPNEWYDLNHFMGALKTIFTKFGPNTLFTLGKTVSGAFPHQFEDVISALSALPPIYEASHRNGYVGYCKMVESDATKRYARMESKTPYPVDYQRGLLTNMLRKYKDSYGLALEVKVISNGERIDPDVLKFEVKW